MIRVALRVLFVGVAVALAASAHAITGDKYEFRKVADGVYALSASSTMPMRWWW